MHTIQ